MGMRKSILQVLFTDYDKSFWVSATGPERLGGYWVPYSSMVVLVLLSDDDELRIVAPVALSLSLGRMQAMAFLRFSVGMTTIGEMQNAMAL